MKLCKSEGPPTSGANRAKQLVLKYPLKVLQGTMNLPYMVYCNLPLSRGKLKQWLFGWCHGNHIVMTWMGADLVLQIREPSYWLASAGLAQGISSTAPADSPRRSYQHCTRSPGSSRTAACLWCRGPFCHRTRACWRGGACSCRSRPSPSGPAWRSPQPGADLGSRTWKRRFST